MPFDTIERLERNVWPEADFETGLISKCHQLRKKQIAELTPGELRVLVGQKIGVEHILPRIIEFLSLDPLIDADYFCGDLLEAVTKLPESYWRDHQPQRHMIQHLIHKNRQAITTEGLRLGSFKPDGL